jgi:hypothetical protein
VAVPLEVGEHDVGLERLLEGLLRLRTVGTPVPPNTLQRSPVRELRNK